MAIIERVHLLVDNRNCVRLQELGATLVSARYARTKHTILRCNVHGGHHLVLFSTDARPIWLPAKRALCSFSIRGKGYEVVASIDTINPNLTTTPRARDATLSRFLILLLLCLAIIKWVSHRLITPADRRLATPGALCHSCKCCRNLMAWRDTSLFWHLKTASHSARIPSSPSRSTTCGQSQPVST